MMMMMTMMTMTYSMWTKMTKTGTERKIQWMTTTMVTAFWTRMKTMEMMSYNCSSVALNILKLFYNDWLIK